MRGPELAETLARRGFIASDAEPQPLGAPGRPWFVSIVLGAAGWLASLSGFVFVMLLFEPDSTADFVVGGLVLLASGYGLYAADREGAFFEQLALALSLAGQLLLIWAVGESTDSAAAAAGFAAVMCSVLVSPSPTTSPGCSRLYSRASHGPWPCVWPGGARTLSGTRPSLSPWPRHSRRGC